MRDGNDLERNDFYDFEDFRLDLREKTLLNNGVNIPLPPKVFDTLSVLVANAGHLLEKEELMNSIWTDSFVEESNLTYNIKMLRKALGDNVAKPRFIETVPKRGYRFIGEVQRSRAGQPLIESNVDEALPDDSISAEPLVSSESTLSPKPSGDHAAIERKARPRLIFAASLTLILLVGALLLTSFFMSGKESYFTRLDRMQGLFLKGEKLSASGKMVDMNISPDGRMIVYNTFEGGRSSIWLRQLATGRTSLLMESDETVSTINFSPDGEYVYFGSIRPGEPLTLNRVSLLGGAPTRVFSGLHSGWSMSPDGREIAYGRNVDRGTALMIADSEGGNEREVFVIERPRSMFGIAWAPDGASIAYHISTGMFGAATYEIFEYDFASGVERRLSDTKWAFLGNWRWLPDRSGLLITARRKTDAVAQIWLLPLAGGEARPITNSASEISLRGVSVDFQRILAQEETMNSKIYLATRRDLSSVQEFGKGEYHLAWTPDGRIVFSAADASDPDIWIASVDGGNRKQLTIGDSLQRYPAVTPDGKKIVFVSTKSGAANVWSMNADGGEQRQLTSGDGEIYPVITPDGASVVFNSGNTGALWKILLEGGEPVKLCDERLMRIALAPDGTRFATFGRSADGKRRLVIKTFPNCATVREFDVVAANPTPRKIEWAKDGRSLIFENEDTSLVGNLWQQPIDGGPPIKLTNFTGDRIYDFSFSPVDDQLAIVRGNWNFDAVLFTGLD